MDFIEKTKKVIFMTSEFCTGKVLSKHDKSSICHDII
jgi:hypothetical protein